MSLSWSHQQNGIKFPQVQAFYRLREYNINIFNNIVLNNYDELGVREYLHVGE